MQRTVALTNFFNGKVGNPIRTIVWGNSAGGLATLKLIEEHPGVYDGVIANCATSAGRPENMDAALAFGLAYAQRLSGVKICGALSRTFGTT